MNALSPGAGGPGEGAGHDPPEQAQLRQLAEEQAALRRVATLVARATPPQEVFAAVAEEVGRLLAADFAILVRYDPRDTLEVVGTWTRTGAPPPTPVGGQLPLGGRNVTTMVYQTGRPARIDYTSDISGVIGQVASHDWGLRTSVGVPVSAESRVWGCIVVAFSRQGRLLPADTEARLASFTELVATAISNTESRTALARLAQEQAALRRVATLVAQGVPPEEVFAAVAEEAGQLLSVDLAGIARYDPDATLTYVASWGRAVDHVPVGSRWPLVGKSVGTMVFETGRPVRVNGYADSASGPLGVASSREMGMRSAVGTPIIVEGRLWGTIGAGSTLEEPLPPDAEARLVSFAELVATAIANAESRAALMRLVEEQAALRRVATLVAQGVPAAEIFSAVSDEVARLFGAQAAVLRFDHDGPAVVFVGVSKTLELPVGTRWEFQPGNGVGGGVPHRMLRPGRRDGLAAGQRARRGSRTPPGYRLDGHEPDRRRGPPVGRDEHCVHGRASAVRHGGTPGEVHRAARHRDRERGEQVGAGRVAQADRRRVRRGASPDRT